MKKRKINGAFLNANRAWLFLIIIMAIGLFIPKFYTAYNIKAVTGNNTLFIWIACGFTICMIAGNMDLTVQYCSTFAALICLGTHSRQKWPWLVCILIAVMMGLIVGLINGLLVTKLKISAFIATLGMQFILRGCMYMYAPDEQSIGRDTAANEFLNDKLVKFLPFSTYFLICLTAVLIVWIFLKWTRTGRNVYIIGGNIETAWLAGVKSDRITILTFLISSVLCSLGGALNGIFSGAANISMGDKGIAPLMIGMTATIIGGTDTSGGSGSVLNTFITMVALAFLKGIFRKTEMQVLVISVIMIICIAYETIAAFRRNKVLGIRPNLRNEYLKEMGKG
ncbi:MAG: ABC transporter permease [Lachnospiraceae bacterium]|nr:ABC transporter permease [Lachnospiraceae bacterium]